MPSPFSLELLLDGLSITLLLIPINCSPDEITFYGTNSGTGLFSDSTHSIKQCFHPLDVSLALILPSLHSYCLIHFLVLSSFYSECSPLGKMGLFIVCLNFLGKY